MQIRSASRSTVAVTCLRSALDPPSWRLFAEQSEEREERDGGGVLTRLADCFKVVIDGRGVSAIFPYSSHHHPPPSPRIESAETGTRKLLVAQATAKSKRVTPVFAATHIQLQAPPLPPSTGLLTNPHASPFHAWLLYQG